MTASQDSSAARTCRARSANPSSAARRARWPRRAAPARPPRPAPAATRRTAAGRERPGPPPTTAAASRGPSESARRDGAVTPSDAGLRAPVAVVVTRGRRSPPGVGVTGGQVLAAGLRRYNGRDPSTVPTVTQRCGAVTCAGPGDGSGPGPPFGPTPSGRLPDRGPLSTGAVGPFPCLTPASPLARGDDGDRTWHPDGTCALRRPWPEAGSYVAEGISRGCPVVDVAHPGVSASGLSTGR